jgi:hypothetical protein
MDLLPLLQLDEHNDLLSEWLFRPKVTGLLPGI